MLWNENRTTIESRLSAGGFLSWMFRGFETYVLFVALDPILDSLLSPTVGSSLYFYAGIAFGAMVLGWGVGGVVRGLTVRVIGRPNTATYSVLGYAIFTALTALSQTFLVFIALRFLAGVMCGTEGERETVFLSRLHPDDRNARGGGSVHAGFGVGIALASVAWFVLQWLDPLVFADVLGTGAWRYLFLIGIIPAVFVVYLRRTTEPERERGTDDRETNEATEETESVSLSTLVGDPSLRKRVVVGVVLVFAATAGWWGVTAWIPVFATDIAEQFGMANPGRWGAVAGVCYAIGGIAGYATVESITDRIGRLGSMFLMLIGAFIAVQAIYLLIRTPYILLVGVAVVGYFVHGQFGWLCVYLSELFSHTARETALGTVYTVARLITVVVPVFAGYEIVAFDGITVIATSFGVLYAAGVLAALFLPSTMDQPFAEQDSL